MIHKRWVFSFLLVIVLSLSLMACNNMADSNLESRISEESSAINSSSQDSDDDLLSEPEDEPYVMSDSERYISLLRFSLGRDSWRNAQDIEPNAFVVFYVSLGSTGVELDKSGGIDENYGNYMFPADSLESTVQKYFVFDVPAEYIRQSQYYNAEKNAYWTGGIGSTEYQEIIDESYDEDLLTIDFQATIDDNAGYYDSWNCTVKIDLSGENYRYVSFESDRKNN